MLKKWIFLQKQAISSCAKNLFEQPILTIITSLMIGFILTWPTFLWFLSIQAKDIIQDWQAKAYISFYLPSTVEAKTREDLFSRIRAIPELKSLKIYTPDDVLKKLVKEDKKNLLALGIDNPLPYVLEVQPQLEQMSSKGILAFYKKFTKLPYLESSMTDLNWFERLAAFERFLNRFSLLLLGILMAGVTFLVSNTLRMVIHTRYEEIQILKLVGAPERFILNPFLYAGVFYGLIGGLVAILSVNVVIGFLQDYFKPMAVLYNYMGNIPYMSIFEVFAVLFIAMLLGLTAAWVFVRYYLNAIEPV